jgi:DNA-binding IclR family transcriptional regulator
VALGYSALASTAVIHVAKPLMQELADSTGAAVALGTRDGLEMIYLSNCRSQSPVSLMLDPGSHLPIWKTAMGLAYAVGLHDDERTVLVAKLQATEADLAADIAAAFKRAMEEHARCGYVTSFGDWHSYVRAVGVPFRPVDGTSPVAITCGGTIEIITDERAHSEIGPRLVALAGTLKAQLEGSTIEPFLTATRP